MKLTTHTDLVNKLRMSGAEPPPPLRFLLLETRSAVARVLLLPVRHVHSGTVPQTEWRCATDRMALCRRQNGTVPQTE